MDLLPTTPGFFQRGIQAFTNLFRSKSEPLLEIQQRAEVSKVEIDNEVNKTDANRDNLQILSTPNPDVPDVPDVRYFPEVTDEPDVPRVPQLNVEEIKRLLKNDADIDDKIASSVPPDIEQQYEETQTRRFNDELAKFTSMLKTEEQYKTQCREGIQVELSHALTACFITPEEGLSEKSYNRIFEDFGEECSSYAARSVGRVTDSWLPDVSLRGAETFFKRTTLCLDALKAYNLFNTPNWRSYKSLEYARMNRNEPAPTPEFWTMQYERDWREEWANEWANEWRRRWAENEKKPASLSPSPPPPPTPPPPLPRPGPVDNPWGPVPPGPGGPANPGYNFRIKIDPYFYVVGPIVEFENIEGRTLIYVKCYDDNTFTTGIYFWVYLSQSEGRYRVFFKLRANSIIEKGFDYTQGTLVDFRLQSILSRYYDMHYSKGKRHPIKINTLKRVIYFVDNMSYLQSRFLDNFPLPLLMYADNSACCRVFHPSLPPYERDTLGRVKGLVGHYYLIHKKYNAIFHQGFPLATGEINNYFPGGHTNPDNQYCTELISSGHHSIFDDFRKGPGPVGSRPSTTTEPLIYCFTTSCPKTTLVSFDDLLNVMNYTATVWFQGFQNFTRILGGILSPVLYVIIGAMVERPDFELSSIRDEMLGITGSARIPTNARDYKKHSAALMTLGTEEFRPGEPTLYLPPSPPARAAARQATPAATQATREPYDFVTEIQRQIEGVRHKASEKYRTVRVGIYPNIAPIPETIPEVEIMKQLTDFGLLAIKADWLKRKFDDSYEAIGSVFPDRPDETIVLSDGITINKIKLYCLCIDDTFLELQDLNCLDPNTPFLQTLPSKFNETRMDYDLAPISEVNVVVDTQAQQYCMKFLYVKTPEMQVKEMYVMIQLSATIVYTVAQPNKILYANNMQKTPIACLPEYRLNETHPTQAGQYLGIIQAQGGGGKYATTKKQKEEAAQAARATQEKERTLQAAQAAPGAGVRKTKGTSKTFDAKEQRAKQVAEDAEAAAAEQKRQATVAAEQKKILDNLHAVLSTDRTMLSTSKRVASWGGFFAGKMMEYLFGPYFQLPTLFKLYARWLQVCHTYYTTALIYNYNTSCRSCVFFNVEPPPGKSYSFAGLFARKLSSEGFIPPPAAPGAPPGGTPLEILTYVSRRLQEHTAAIKQIGENVTAPFLDYNSVDDRSTVTGNSSVSPESSTSPSTSVSRTSSAYSDFSDHPTSRAEKARKEFNTRDLLLGDSLNSDDSAPSYEPSSQSKRPRSGSESPEPNPPVKNLSKIVYVGDGGSLPINKSTKRCKTKRKNRKTTRKNRKVNRMVKKHNTKYKTYKRKANGRKLKGNNHKNNKTMRRYRRVRK